MIKGSKMTSEQIKRNREAQKKVWSNLELRKRHSEIHKQSMSNPKVRALISQATKNAFANPELRKKISAAQKKRFERESPWNKGIKTGKSSWIKGKHHTAESNLKNRLAHLGKPAWNKGKKTGLTPWNKGLKETFHHSEEARLKIRESRAKQTFPIKDSLPEIKLQDFLKKLNIEFIPHKHMKIIHSYQCDIFIPSKNLVIEIDGDYWHGNQNTERFKVLNQAQIKTKERDAIRTKELLEKGFKVLRLWESDINKMTLENFMKILSQKSPKE